MVKIEGKMKTIILCTDKENGRLFFGKRTATDAEVRKHILALDDKIFVDNYTAGQFKETEDKSKLCIVDSPARIADGTAFIEKEDVPEDADRIIIFRWDKKYPADKYFDFSFAGWHKTKNEKFQGYAHDKVTMEVWEKNKN